MHGQKGYKPEMLSDGPVADLVRATNDVLSEPLHKMGVSQEVPPELTAALEQNSFYFSGFKTHHEMVEASRLMKGEDGTFKPFEQFQRDVQRIDSAYNRSYLQAEYNFAVQSTQMAVKWKEWEKDGDDYDLQYRTAGDDRVRDEHALLDGTTLPPSDPFWNNYLPPLGWNCRCTAVQVRKGKYPQSDSADAIAKGQSCTAKPKQQIFRFNPGKQEKIFPPKHPYYKGIEKTDCRNCTRKLSSPNNGNPKCVLCGTLSNKNDIASELSKLHKLEGKEYNKQLQTISEMKVFKPHPDSKNVFWVGNETDKDMPNLLAGAQKLTADKDTKVFILPNPSSGRTADYIVVRKGIYKDYDLKTIIGEHSVGNRLRESIGQSRRVVLNMATQYNPRTLAKEIKSYFESNEKATEVLILKGKRNISIKRNFTLSNEYIHSFISNYNKRK